MEKNEKDLDNIELRSEKVRNVIGKVPPRLVSLGTVIISVIVLVLAVAFYKIPYPISIEANGEVVNHRTVQVFVPYKYLYLLPLHPIIELISINIGIRFVFCSFARRMGLGGRDQFVLGRFSPYRGKEMTVLLFFIF